MRKASSTPEEVPSSPSSCRNDLQEYHDWDPEKVMQATDDHHKENDDDDDDKEVPSSSTCDDTKSSSAGSNYTPDTTATVTSGSQGKSKHTTTTTNNRNGGGGISMPSRTAWLYWTMALVGLICLGTGGVLLGTRLVFSSSSENSNKNNTTTPPVLPDNEKDEPHVPSPHDETNGISATTAAPTTTIPTQPLCTHVSYQLNVNHWTADDVNNNGLPQGLQVAATSVIQEFCDTWEDPHNTNVQVQYSPMYPATVKSVVDLPATLCPNTDDSNSQHNNNVFNDESGGTSSSSSSCLLVQQIACVVVSSPPSFSGNHNNNPSLDSSLLAMVEAGLQQALRNAIATGTLIEKIPPEFL